MPRPVKKYSPPRGSRFDDPALNATIRDIYDALNDRTPTAAPVAVRSGAGGSGAGATSWRCGKVTLLNGTTTVVVVPDPPLDAALNCPNSCVTIQATPADTWGSATEFYIDSETETTFAISVDADPGADVDFYWFAAPCPPEATTPPSIAVWGKQVSTDSEGLWTFDIADPEGTLTQLFTSSTHGDLGRFEYYDGFIIYGRDVSTVPEIWKIKPNGDGDQLIHSGTGFTSGFRINVTYDPDNGTYFYWNGNNEIRKWDGTTDSLCRGGYSTSQQPDLVVEGDGVGLYEIRSALNHLDYAGTVLHTLAQNGSRAHVDHATGNLYVRWDGGSTTDNVSRYASDLTGKTDLKTGLVNTTDNYAYDRDYESGEHYVWEDGPNGTGFYVYDGSFSTQTLVLRFHEATDLRILKSQYS